MKISIVTKHGRHTLKNISSKIRRVCWTSRCQVPAALLTGQWQGDRGHTAQVQRARPTWTKMQVGQVDRSHHHP